MLLQSLKEIRHGALQIDGTISMVFIIQKDAYEASSVGQPRTENVEMNKPYSLL